MGKRQDDAGKYPEFKLKGVRAYLSHVTETFRYSPYSSESSDETHTRTQWSRTQDDFQSEKLILTDKSGKILIVLEDFMIIKWPVPTEWGKSQIS